MGDWVVLYCVYLSQNQSEKAARKIWLSLFPSQIVLFNFTPVTKIPLSCSLHLSYYHGYLLIDAADR